MRFFCFFLFILYAIINVNAAEVNFSDPTTTPTGSIPNLSDAGQTAQEPQITTNSTGQYVYAIWQRLDGSTDIIQVAISDNFGVAWKDPTTTPTGSTPNLSVAGYPARASQITTNSTGQYVYAVWRRFNGSKYIIQVAISDDFGVAWKDPTTTPTGSTPNLSVAGQSADQSQITTDSTGQYVYAVWRRVNDVFNNIIQVAISDDFGVTWKDPTTTPTGSTPNLSVAGQSAFQSQITTNSTGQYVYATWARSDGSNDIIQVAISDDFGVTWKDPTTTPTGSTPNLSVAGQNAIRSQITTDSTGQYVYATWARSDGSRYIIQVAISDDFGIAWKDPTTTPTGSTPNLSVAGQSAIYSQITTDSTGQYVYTVWQRFNGSNDIIQVAISLRSVAFAVSSFQEIIRFFLSANLINKLNWNAVSDATMYRIYADQGLTQLITTITNNTLQYIDRNVKFGDIKTYYVTWVDNNGINHDTQTVVVP